ncbi:hypothetical protein DE146DRAFT_628045 [Phaeosphaeria sp. MPI-PUGE-AT-0046c]|nr:hypothetical protein DE146DRAFT_628045 [Phaeosphaeria sp. MPI-PUGE-AT-0046c]
MQSTWTPPFMQHRLLSNFQAYQNPKLVLMAQRPAPTSVLYRHYSVSLKASHSLELLIIIDGNITELRNRLYKYIIGDLGELVTLNKPPGNHGSCSTLCPSWEQMKRQGYGFTQCLWSTTTTVPSLEFTSTTNKTFQKVLLGQSIECFLTMFPIQEAKPFGTVVVRHPNEIRRRLSMDVEFLVRLAAKATNFQFLCEISCQSFESSYQGSTRKVRYRKDACEDLLEEFVDPHSRSFEEDLSLSAYWTVRAPKFHHYCTKPPEPRSHI